MHEGAGAPSYLRPGLGLRRAGVSVRKQRLRTSSRAKRGLRNPQNRLCGSRLEALWASKSASPTADGKIEDFDAAPSERPKWPLPLSFFFSPRAAFHLPGVPALRSAKALSSGLQPRKRGLRPAVTEGDRKMMQLEKMKISFFRRVLTLSTPRGCLLYTSDAADE